ISATATSRTPSSGRGRTRRRRTEGRADAPCSGLRRRSCGLPFSLGGASTSADRRNGIWGREPRAATATSPPSRSAYASLTVEPRVRRPNETRWQFVRFDLDQDASENTSPSDSWLLLGMSHEGGEGNGQRAVFLSWPCPPL